MFMMVKINNSIAASIGLLDRLTKEGGVDLHLHSLYSDGSKSPEELVDLAHKRKLKAIAIADHDSIGAMPRAKIAVGKLKIESGYDLLLIPAVELAVWLEEQIVHLLAYFPYEDIGKMEDFLQEQQAERENRNQIMLNKLIDLKVIKQRDLQSYLKAGHPLLGRTHIAKLLVKKGQAGSISEAFKKYLGKGKPAFVARNSISLDAACKLIHQLGGAAILAHPQKYGWGRADEPDTNRFVKEFESARSFGIDGVESFHSEAERETQLQMMQAANHLGLISTAGSDYHGSNKDNCLIYNGDQYFYPRD